MAYKSIMKREYKARSGITMGGIGTGGIELRNDGVFYNFNIMNNYPAASGDRCNFASNSILFFKVRYQEAGENPRMKILQVDQGYEVGAVPLHYYVFPWMSGVDAIEYNATFPFVKMKFSDEEMPFDIEMEAYSPFIPGDVKNSALPGVVFHFDVKSKTDKKVDVMIMAVLRNSVGYDVEEKIHKTRVSEGKGYKLFEMTCEGMDKDHSSYGYQSMASLAEDSTYYLGWEHVHPYYEIVLRNKELPNIEDTEGRNHVDTKTDIARADQRLFSTIAVSRSLANKGSFQHTFITTWNFPNRYSGMGLYKDKPKDTPVRFEGHYYSNFFKNAEDVAVYLIENLQELHSKTEHFIKNFYDSSLEEYVLDQVNSQLNTFIASSWLTKKMNYGIGEGLTPDQEWAGLGTIDVALYGSIATLALFPELDKNMMRVYKAYQFPNGDVPHSINRDFLDTEECEKTTGRVDLAIQYALLSLRNYLYTGDEGFIIDMWPSIKKAMEYSLIERDKDNDGIPDMEGIMCTYDNFPMYGTSSLIGSQWLTTLSLAIEVAKELKDVEAYDRYCKVYDKAKETFESKLWNGSYYRLYNASDKEGTKDEGCLTDQLVGIWANHFTSKKQILDKDRIKQSLQNIMKLSYKEDYGLVNCRWPEDGFLHEVDKDCWVDQANTCWSGVELAFASFLIYQGFVEEGMKVIKNVDDRYRKSGMYFDHIEFGGHYYRPMSAWGIINAVLGLVIEKDHYSFSPKLKKDCIKLFFAFHEGNAHYVQDRSNREISLSVCSGTLNFSKLSFELDGLDVKKITIRKKEEVLSKDLYRYQIQNNNLKIEFYNNVMVKEGSAFVISIK